MASWLSVFQGLQSQMVSALSGLVTARNVLIGYPSTDLIQAVGQPGEQFSGGTNPLSPTVCVYDRKVSKDTTRWLPHYVSADGWEATPANVTFTPTSAYLSPGDTASFDFLNAAAANDAVGVTIGMGNAGVVFTASGAMDAQTFSSNLASSINGELSAYVVATASGSMLEMQNVSAADLSISLAAGNIATALLEIKRTERDAGVIALCNSQTVLSPVEDMISQTLASLQLDFGYEVTDGTYVRLVNYGDIAIWDNTLANIARHDWLISLEYGITVKEIGYPILAPILNRQFSNALGTLGG